MCQLQVVAGLICGNHENMRIALGFGASHVKFDSFSFFLQLTVPTTSPIVLCRHCPAVTQSCPVCCECSFSSSSVCGSSGLGSVSSNPLALRVILTLYILLTY